MGDVNKKGVLKIDIREVDGIPKKGQKSRRQNEKQPQIREM